MLVVEVIRLNRILDLLVTLDATYFSVQRIYVFAQISWKLNVNQNITTWIIEKKLQNTENTDLWKSSIIL